MKLHRSVAALISALAPLVVAGCMAGNLSAREIVAAGPSQLAGALQAARRGDSVTLKNGEWKDTRFVVNQGGSPGEPLEIRAETPGGVKLSGASALEINAPYVTIDGFLFQGGATPLNAVIQFKSHHGIVRNTAIIDYNPPSFETECYWVFFAGDDNLVERCYFKGKNNHHPLIGNAIDGSRRNTVRGSYFKNIPYIANSNGREIIRVWGSGKTEERDDDGAFFTIAENLFDHADGEGTETISLKSNHNVVRNNTILATRGGINIRRGNFNTVKDNIVLGQGVDGAHGLRMSGRDNVVQANYISGCDYGIRVACGEFIAEALTPSYAPDVKPNSKRTAQVRIPTYPQVRNLVLTDNVVVGISGPDLEVGSSYKGHWPASQQVLLPEDCVFTQNRFVRPQGGSSVLVTIAEQTAPLDRFNFRPNSYSRNVLAGSGSIAAAARDGFAIQALPDGWSEAQEGAVLKPLTAEDVGPAWIVALRKAGGLASENTLSAGVPVTSEPKKKKKIR